jgi:hypothetical protein
MVMAVIVIFTMGLCVSRPGEIDLKLLNDDKIELTKDMKLNQLEDKEKKDKEIYSLLWLQNFLLETEELPDAKLFVRRFRNSIPRSVVFIRPSSFFKGKQFKVFRGTENMKRYFERMNTYPFHYPQRVKLTRQQQKWMKILKLYHKLLLNIHESELENLHVRVTKYCLSMDSNRFIN